MAKIIRFLRMLGLFVVAAVVFAVVFEIASHDSDIAIVVLFVMFAIGLAQAMKFVCPLIVSTVRDVGELSREKAKHIPAHSAEDARLSLLLALMTPDERDELKARLVDEIGFDEDVLPLANLLARQQDDVRQHS